MLTDKIGLNAGLVWKALGKGELSLKEVKKVTKLTEKELHLALGWLAREGKVRFREEEKNLFVTLV